MLISTLIDVIFAATAGATVAAGSRIDKCVEARGSVAQRRDRKNSSPEGERRRGAERMAYHG